MSEQITVYAKMPDFTGPCPFCDKAKAWLNERGIPFKLMELLPSERQELYNRLELIGADRTVPQVIVTDCEGESHRIGGYEQLIVSGVEGLFTERGNGPPSSLS